MKFLGCRQMPKLEKYPSIISAKRKRKKQGMPKKTPQSAAERNKRRITVPREIWELLNIYANDEGGKVSEMIRSTITPETIACNIIRDALKKEGYDISPMTVGGFKICPECGSGNIYVLVGGRLVCRNCGYDQRITCIPKEGEANVS